MGDKVLHYDFSQEPLLVGSDYILLDQSGNERNINLGATHYWDRENGIGYYLFDGSRTLVGDKIFTDNANQSWTVAAWIYLDSNAKSGQYLNNFNLGNRIVHSSSNGRALLYINSGVNDAYTYSTGAIPAGQWIHITFALNTIPGSLRCQFYLNGKLYGTSTNFTETDNPYGFAATHIIGQGFEGKLADMRIYDRDLTTAEILNLYEARAIITKKGEFLAESFINNVEPTINYWDFEEYERCWNGGSSNVCSLRTVTGKHSMTIKGQATVASAAGYAYVYPQYKVPVGEKYTFSCVVENFNAKSSIIGLRIRDGNNGDNLSGYVNFTIQPSEKKRIFVTSITDSALPTITPALSIYSDVDGYIDIEITEIQVEQKLSPTPFTDSRRPKNYPSVDFDFTTNRIDKFGRAVYESFNEVGIIEGLIGYWDFRNGDLTDLTGNGRNAEYFSEGSHPTFNTEGAVFTSGTALKIENILTAIDNEPFTIVMRLKRAGGYRALMSYPGNIIEFNINASYQAIRVRDSSGYAGPYYTSTLGGSFRTHIVTFDKSTLNYYLDGELVDSYTNHLNNVSFSTHIILGNWTSLTQSFSGTLESLKVFDRELTIEEIKVEHNLLAKELQILKTGEVIADGFIEF